MDASHHRKIDLQSSSDLAYLHENIKQAAREKIDLAIPPSAAPAGEDAYRSKVEQLVNEVCCPFLASFTPLLTYVHPSHESTHSILTAEFADKRPLSLSVCNSTFFKPSP